MPCSRGWASYLPIGVQDAEAVDQRLPVSTAGDIVNVRGLQLQRVVSTFAQMSTAFSEVEHLFEQWYWVGSARASPNSRDVVPVNDKFEYASLNHFHSSVIPISRSGRCCEPDAEVLEAAPGSDSAPRCGSNDPPDHSIQPLPRNHQRTSPGEKGSLSAGQELA